LPAAIGALLADNEKGGASNVILLDGDGSFQMNIPGLATVYAEQLPLKIIILNNQNLGMVYQWEERFLNGEHAHTDMRLPRAGRSYPDFCTIAKGYSIDGEEVREPEELDAAIGRMLAADGPYLLDIQIAHGDMVLPMIPAGKTCEDIIVQ
jgi:acetolactate synthase-1/2/3 large subunit